MSAAKWNRDIEENSQFDFYVTKYDSECTPQSVTGWGAKFQVRAERLVTSPVIYEASVGSGITVEPGGVTGMFHIQLTVPQVNSPGVSGWDRAYFDLVVWPADGSITDRAKRLVEGVATWKPAATHP